jgi:hypothetical protein
LAKAKRLKCGLVWFEPGSVLGRRGFKQMMEDGDVSIL